MLDSDKTWFFSSSGKLITDRMKLIADGSISGYQHPNEERWKIEGGILHFINRLGDVTSILHKVDDTDSSHVFYRGHTVGRSVDVELEISSIELNIRTFDLFDTLIARRCYRPYVIFQVIEEKSGFVGYHDDRIKAENAVRRTDYTLLQIYQHLVRHSNYSETEAKILYEMEIAEEARNLFPIKEIISTVGPRDIIVSDMYLPQDFVDHLVRDVCGLKNRIYLHPRGKATGKAWVDLQKFAKIKLHTGDNAETDLESPSKFGIPANIVTQWKRTPVETLVADGGFYQLSNLMRELRLSTWKINKIERSLQLAQTQLNIPLLFMASCILLDHTLENNIDKVLFSSRDCNLWVKLFDLFRPHANHSLESSYFYTSRRARINSSVTYRSYFNDLRGKKTCIVDICGTGHSISKFLEHHGCGDSVEAFLIHKPLEGSADANYQKLHPVSKKVRLKSLSRAKYDNVILEALNADTCGMCIDIKAETGIFTPIFGDAVQQPWLDMIRLQHRLFYEFLRLAAIDQRLFNQTDVKKACSLIAPLMDEIPDYANHLSNFRDNII